MMVSVIMLLVLISVRKVGCDIERGPGGPGIEVSKRTFWSRWRGVCVGRGGNEHPSSVRGGIDRAGGWGVAAVGKRKMKNGVEGRREDENFENLVENCGETRDEWGGGRERM